MLFLVDDNLLDIVRENTYVDVLTVRSSNREALKPLTRYTGGGIVRVADPIFPWIIHVPKGNTHLDIQYRTLCDSELINRITPEPQAYFFDYCYEDESGELVGDYGYCWPSEIAGVVKNLTQREYPVLDTPTFITLFYLPKELLAAS